MIGVYTRTGIIGDILSLSLFFFFFREEYWSGLPFPSSVSFIFKKVYLFDYAWP